MKKIKKTAKKKRKSCNARRRARRLRRAKEKMIKSSVVRGQTAVAACVDDRGFVDG